MPTEEEMNISTPFTKRLGELIRRKQYELALVSLLAFMSGYVNAGGNTGLSKQLDDLGNLMSARLIE